MHKFAIYLIYVLIFSAATARAEHSETHPDALTPHGSEIDINHVDLALLGTWVMVHGQIETPAGILIMKATGRRLSILNSGSFQEDYQTEASAAPLNGLVQGQTFGTGVDRFAPRDSCRMRGEGLSVGHMNQNGALDTNSDPAGFSDLTMRITINKAASTAFKIRCHDDDVVRGNMVTPPLGFGFTKFDASGPYVEYHYQIYPLLDAAGETLQAWHGLEIWSTTSPAPTARYFFIKEN